MIGQSDLPVSNSRNSPFRSTLDALTALKTPQNRYVSQSVSTNRDPKLYRPKSSIFMGGTREGSSSKNSAKGSAHATAVSSAIAQLIHPSLPNCSIGSHENANNRDLKSERNLSQHRNQHEEACEATAQREQSSLLYAATLQSQQNMRTSTSMFMYCQKLKYRCSHAGLR